LDLIVVIHVFLMYVLSAGIGGFFAIYLTSLMFRAVDPKTLYVSFVSVVAAVATVLFLLVISLSSDKRSTGEMITFMLQSAAIFAGAWVGRYFGSDRGKAFCK
jgi:hypothetical protein